MSDAVFPVPEEWANTALIDQARYLEKYQQSLADPDGFWREEAQRIDWIAPFETVKDTSFTEEDLHIRWFTGGKLNIAANCLDRHLATRGNEVAIIWEPDDPAKPGRKITYAQLHRGVCRFANVLKAQGVAKGDRVTIYLPMVPEAAVAMLACARIGAVHSIVFAGFSPDALAGRIEDCQSNIVITSDEGLRGGKPIPLKANVDAACEKTAVDTVIVLRHTGADVPMVAGAMWIGPLRLPLNQMIARPK